MSPSTISLLKRATLALLLATLWSAALIAGTLFGWWQRPLASTGDPREFLQAAIPLIREGNRANTAVILIDSGTIRAEYYSTTADSIDGNTVFATASLSKWITAHAVMKLVEQGKLDLDRPVETYLTRWRFPAGATGTRQVTARRLLSHTAGLTDGRGVGNRDQLHRRIAVPAGGGAEHHPGHHDHEQGASHPPFSTSSGKRRAMWSLTRASISSGVPSVSAWLASACASASVDARTTLLITGMATAFIDSSPRPSPRRISANIGSPAISPHIATGTLWSRAAWATERRMRRIAGWSGRYR